MAITYLSGDRIQGSSTGALNTILTFTGSGTFTPTEVFDVDYLVIGGGAGTGTSNGGGGGAGAFRESDVTTSDSTITVATEEYTITVGAGSVGVSSGDASHGSASSINSSTLSIITADGGGAGGRGGQNAPTYSGNGSGGGSGNGASGTDGGTYGNNGGDSANNDAGGGAGASGNGVNSNGGGGNGGNGSSSSITGSSVTYCGGGGSAQDGSLGTGGSGGGGNGTTSGAGADATGYGSGGGGGAGGKGGDGSDGVVILSFDASKTGYSTTGTVATTTTTQDDKATITNVPVGTRFEETDTRKIYRCAQDLISGTDLKVYTKFDDSSGAITNQASSVSGSSGQLGSGANITLAGTGTTTYGVTGTPTNLGNAVTLPQTSTTSGIYGTFGDSASQFNFMWSGTPKWTMCFWAKQSASAVSNTTLIKNNNGEGTKGFEIYWYGTSTVKLRFNMTNGSSGNPAGRPFNAEDFTDFSTDGNWHFYSFVVDGSLGSNHLKVTRDGGTTENFSKTSGAFASSGNAYSRMSLRTTYASIGSYVPPEQSLCELSIFDRVLTDAELATLYNSGDGFQLDTGLKVWTEKGSA